MEKPDESSMVLLATMQKINSPFMSTLGLAINLLCVFSPKREPGRRAFIIAKVVCISNLVLIALNHLAVELLLQEFLELEPLCQTLQLLRTATTDLETWLLVGTFVAILDEINVLWVVAASMASLAWEIYLELHHRVVVLEGPDKLLVCTQPEEFIVLLWHAALDNFPTWSLLICVGRLIKAARFLKGAAYWRLLVAVLTLSGLTVAVHCQTFQLIHAHANRQHFVQLLLQREISDVIIRLDGWILLPLFVTCVQLGFVGASKESRSNSDAHQVVVVELEDIEQPVFTRQGTAATGSEL